MKTLAEATEGDIMEVAKQLATERSKVWEELSEEEQRDYITGATFCFSWFCI
jgi:5-formaminoimidazole-4-carboxamide-1-beta-D-ribofuranosyl 5'-monophosphate synthetase